MADAELTPKEVGGFRILRRLASGAASDVLLARAEGPHGFQRVVALKILLARAKADPDFERSFAREASAYARLSHPAVVKLYDFFAADGQLVMVLEFVDGLPLHKLRAMLAIAGERIDDKAAIFLGFRIFSALAAAHGARDPATGEFAPIAHADVNPSNILVPWDGHVKLGDFGIARAAGLQSDPRSGFIKGTYGYVAPEQVAGKDPTVRADVYSAGLILWELLARRKAVQRGSLSDAQVLKAMAHPEFPALELLRPDLDATIRGAVRRALEPDPEKRSITAEEMVAVLRQGVVAEEGRKSLADALTRVRSSGAVDPLATTTQVAAPSDIEAHGPPTPHASSQRHPDSDQTAEVPAVTEEDLGKIAFYGRINFPADSQVPGPPRGSALASPALAEPLSPEPPPVPPDVPTVVDLPSPVANRSNTMVTPPAFAAAGRPRAIPRPSHEKKISGYPTLPAPPLVPDEPEEPKLVAAGAPPPVATPITVPPVTPIVPIVPPLPAADPVPVAPPLTERSPEGSSPPEALAEAIPEIAPGEVAAAPVAGSVRPNEPPYVLSSLPSGSHGAGSRSTPWLLAGALGVALAAGAAFFLVRGDLLGATSTAPSEPSAPAASVAPSASAATPVAVASAAPSTSATSASVAPPAASAAPSASSSAEPATSAAPSASAPSASVPSAAPSAAPSAEPIAAASAKPTSAASAAAVASAAPAVTTPATPAAPSGPEPADSGQLNLPASAAGHRIFVDDKVAGEGTVAIHVHCGSHVVRIGSAGKEHKLDVPCGGSIDVP